MPRATQQTPPQPTNKRTSLPPKTGSVLSRAVDIADATPSGLKIVGYGRAKTGKTWMACTFPKPLLLLAPENGSLTVAQVKGVKFLPIESITMMKQLVDELATGRSGFASIVLDNLTVLQDLSLCEILNIKKMPEQKSWGIATRDQWGQSALQTKELVRSILDLEGNKVIIAHERNFSENDNGKENLAFGEVPFVGPSATKSVTAWLNGACDYIVQTYLRPKIKVTTIEVLGEKITREEPTGEFEYCLRIGPHSVYQTGFRAPKTDKPMPNDLVNPTYEKIMEVIKGRY